MPGTKRDVEAIPVAKIADDSRSHRRSHSGKSPVITNPRGYDLDLWIRIAAESNFSFFGDLGSYPTPDSLSPANSRIPSWPSLQRNILYLLNSILAQNGVRIEIMRNSRILPFR